MSVEKAASLFKSLRNEDFRVLLGAELAMSHYQFAPAKRIIKISNLRVDEATFRLNRLQRIGFIQKIGRAFLGYDGYTITSPGYDSLALNALVKSGVLEALGRPLGVGKEADVYEALSPDEKRIVVKFHRLGRTSFRQTRRARAYVAHRSHITWLYQSRLAGEREYEALNIAYPVGVSVPRPIAQNRHAVVMGLIKGTELRFAELVEPKLVLKHVLGNIRKCYTEARIVHGDLSEFNILVQPDGKVVIIDWPQYLSRDRRGSKAALLRDMKNVAHFFAKRHHVKFSLVHAISYVTGGVCSIRPDV